MDVPPNFMTMRAIALTSTIPFSRRLLRRADGQEQTQSALPDKEPQVAGLLAKRRGARNAVYEPCGTPFLEQPAKEDGRMERVAIHKRMKERTALHCTNRRIRSMSAAMQPARWPKWPVSAAPETLGPIGFGRMRAASYPKDGR